MKTFSIEEYEEYRECYAGFCVECGEFTESGVEPDARKYKCEGCGEMAVYGLEECALMGLVS